MAAISENQPVRATPSWRLKLDRFWRWWTSELLAMVPERFANLAGGSRVPLLGIEAGTIVLLEPRSPNGKPEARIDITDTDSARAGAAVRALLEGAGETRGRSRLALPPHEALVRRVTMPAATEENLATVLGFEMDRLTPFRADEVYYDHRIAGRDAASGTLSVILGVARRDVVEARLAQARALGLSVQGVVVPEAAGRGGGTPLDVLPSAERGEREKPRERLAKQVLVGVAILLLFAALVLPALRKRAEVLAIKPTLDKAHAEAQATDALIRELERQVGDYNFVLARKHTTYPALAYVEEVTRLLPDNTWLQQLEVKTVGKAREVLISGETISSSKLIEILEQSRVLQNASPRGTVTRGTQPGTERFLIAAEARPRTEPESVPVTQTQVAVAPSPPFAPPQAAPPAPTAPAAVAPAGAAPPATAPPPAAAPPGTSDLIFRPRGVPYVPPEMLKPPAAPPKAPAAEAKPPPVGTKAAK